MSETLVDELKINPLGLEDSEEAPAQQYVFVNLMSCRKKVVLTVGYIFVAVASFFIGVAITRQVTGNGKGKEICRRRMSYANLGFAWCDDEDDACYEQEKNETVGASLELAKIHEAAGIHGSVAVQFENDDGDAVKFKSNYVIIPLKCATVALGVALTFPLGGWAAGAAVGLMASFFESVTEVVVRCRKEARKWKEWKEIGVCVKKAIFSPEFAIRTVQLIGQNLLGMIFPGYGIFTLSVDAVRLGWDSLNSFIKKHPCFAKQLELVPFDQLLKKIAKRNGGKGDTVSLLV